MFLTFNAECQALSPLMSGPSLELDFGVFLGICRNRAVSGHAGRFSMPIRWMTRSIPSFVASEDADNDQTRQNLKRVSKVSVTVFRYACITITRPCEFLG